MVYNTFEFFNNLEEAYEKCRLIRNHRNLMQRLTLSQSEAENKTVTIGGENSFPFYTFDAPTENTAKIGVEISDLGLDEFSEGVRAYYEGATTMADIAKKAAAIEGADFVALILDGGDPNGANKSVEELIGLLKK